MLSEISQTEKVEGHMFFLMWKLERKRKRKVGIDLMKIKGRSVEERTNG